MKPKPNPHDPTRKDDETMTRTEADELIYQLSAGIPMNDPAYINLIADTLIYLLRQVKPASVEQISQNRMTDGN